MLNACDKTWINENNIVEGLRFPDMTCRGTQYEFDSELWLINAWCIENLTELKPIFQYSTHEETR